MVGLETALSLTLSNLVHSGILSINQAIEKMTVGPAKILGIEAGTLSPGAPADITIIDPEAKVIVDSSTFKSMSRNTPFDGYELKGKAVGTIVNGKAVFSERNLEVGYAQVN